MSSVAMTREATCVMIPQRGSLSRTSTCSTISSVSTLVDDDQHHHTKGFCHCGAYLSRSLSASADVLREEGRDVPLKPLVAEITQHLRSRLGSTPPKIIGLLATDDVGCKSYAASTAKACAVNGLSFETLQVEAVFESVKQTILRLNEDLAVDGLIVYFPIFGPELDATLRSLVSARIDVEGVHPANLATSAQQPPASINADDSTVHPCTPLAVIRILESIGFGASSAPQLGGKVVTVINRSETVGRPLAIMLANLGAVVYSIDVEGVQTFEKHDDSSLCINHTSLSPAECFGMSDLIVSAVPSPRYKVQTSGIRPGAVCINVATDNNFEDDVKTRASFFVRRVGSITTLMLHLNALSLQRACRRG